MESLIFNLNKNMQQYEFNVLEIEGKHDSTIASQKAIS
jgi:hypothetical protein